MLIQNVKNWWLSLANREQAILLIGAFFLLVFIFQRLVYIPINANLQSVKNTLEKQQEVLIWMQERSQLVRNLSFQGKSKQSKNLKLDKSIAQRINLAAKQFNIRIKHFQQIATNPSNEGNPSSTLVKIDIHKIKFNLLLKWLKTLDYQYRVDIKTISINEADKKGLVNIKVTFMAR